MQPLSGEGPRRRLRSTATRAPQTHVAMRAEGARHADSQEPLRAAGAEARPPTEPPRIVFRGRKGDEDEETISTSDDPSRTNCK
jgi:hypothetical protein